jgi:hypothetical protein
MPQSIFSDNLFYFKLSPNGIIIDVSNKLLNFLDLSPFDLINKPNQIFKYRCVEICSKINCSSKCSSRSNSLLNALFNNEKWSGISFREINNIKFSSQDIMEPVFINDKLDHFLISLIIIDNNLYNKSNFIRFIIKNNKITYNDNFFYSFGYLKKSDLPSLIDVDCIDYFDNALNNVNKIFKCSFFDKNNNNFDSNSYIFSSHFSNRFEYIIFSSFELFGSDLNDFLFLESFPTLDINSLADIND